MYKDTSNNTNIQYDTSTLKVIRDGTFSEISKLTTQKLVISSIWEYADSKFNNKYWYKMLKASFHVAYTTSSSDT